MISQLLDTVNPNYPYTEVCKYYAIREWLENCRTVKLSMPRQAGNTQEALNFVQANKDSIYVAPKELLYQTIRRRVKDCPQDLQDRVIELSNLGAHLTKMGDRVKTIVIDTPQVLGRKWKDDFYSQIFNPYVKIVIIGS